MSFEMNDIQITQKVNHGIKFFFKVLLSFCLISSKSSFVLDITFLSPNFSSNF